MEASLADYRLDRRIGSGASGEVFEAAPVSGGEPLAVKIIFPHLSESADNVARFERQCRLLSTVEHPGVVPVLEWGFCEERRQLFLSMPLLRGQTLGAYMRGAESTLELVELLDMALQGLAAAHAKGLVHRDVKPDNIFVVDGEPPEARIIDFGLVRQVDATGPTATQMGLGTPSYMAPEQATSARTVGVAADVWSLGVVLYRIVSGRLPFVGEGPYETMIRVVSTPPPPLPGVPEALQTLVFACLQKDPDKRPADASVLRAELTRALALPGVRDWLRARPWHGSREPTVEPLDPTFIHDPTQTSVRELPPPALSELDPEPEARAPPPRRWPWAAVALLTLTLGLGLGPLWWPSGDRVEPLPRQTPPAPPDEAEATPLPEALLPLPTPDASEVGEAEASKKRARGARARPRTARRTRTERSAAGREAAQTPSPAVPTKSAAPEEPSVQTKLPDEEREPPAAASPPVEAASPKAEVPTKPKPRPEPKPAKEKEKDEVDPRNILTF
ncbi:MAG: serine/threonine-protein kinase [Myxococcota bacterium]